MNNIGLFVVENISIISLAILSYYLNSYSNSGIHFGIRIPKKYKNIKEIADLEKEYKKLIIIIFSIVIVFFNIILFFNINSTEKIIALILGATIIISLLIHGLIFVIYYNKIKTLKKEKNLNYKSNNVVVVDTTLIKPKKNEKYKPLEDWTFLLPGIVPILLLIITYSKSENLTYMSEYELYRYPTIGIIMCIFMYLLAKISLKSKVDLSSRNLETTIIKKKKIKRLLSIFFLVNELNIIIFYSIIQFGIIYGFYTDKLLISINIVISISMIIFLLVFIMMGKSGGDTKENANEEEIYKDDDENWILGMFYYNKNDPAFMIEKRVGIGYTLNFANIKSWILLGFTIIFIIVMSYL